MTEKVLVVPTANLELFGLLHDGACDDAAVLETFDSVVLEDFAPQFMVRSEAENDPTHKQLIPYVVIIRGREVFSYRRSPKGGEGRLHGKWSVGVGGHINEPDGASTESAYWNGLWRELEEEVGLPKEKMESNDILGLLYDPSTEVGRVHLGVVHLVRIPVGVNLGATEGSLASGEFRHLAELQMEVAGNPDAFEVWSQLVLSKLVH